MKFDPNEHHILMGHLREVEKVMLESGASYDEAEGVVADLSFQIDEMMQEMDGEISDTDQIAILRRLDSPSAYGHGNKSHSEEETNAKSSTAGAPPHISTRMKRLLRRVALAGILLVPVLIVGFLLIASRNRIILAEETVSSSYAQVETVLQRRFDLIPNLASTVKGFADQEKEIFLEIARLRDKWGVAKTVGEKVDTANQLEGKLTQVLNLTETYPQLRSNEQFVQLQYQLEATENRISVERNRYNNSLRNYNALVRRFPGSLFGFETREGYFRAVEAAATAPSVSF